MSTAQRLEIEFSESWDLRTHPQITADLLDQKSDRSSCQKLTRIVKFPEPKNGFVRGGYCSVGKVLNFFFEIFDTIFAAEKVGDEINNYVNRLGRIITGSVGKKKVKGCPQATWVAAFWFNAIKGGYRGHKIEAIPRSTGSPF